MPTLTAKISPTGRTDVYFVLMCGPQIAKAADGTLVDVNATNWPLAAILGLKRASELLDAIDSLKTTGIPDAGITPRMVCMIADMLSPQTGGIDMALAESQQMVGLFVQMGLLSAEEGQKVIAGI
jgi:hypothetical protein